LRWLVDAVDVHPPALHTAEHVANSPPGMVLVVEAILRVHANAADLRPLLAGDQLEALEPPLVPERVH
jgi:hypothetical protein